MKTLKQARKLAGLTQEELAAKTGITNANIYYIENGKIQPRISTREKIEKVLGSIDWGTTYLRNNINIGMLNISDEEEVARAIYRFIETGESERFTYLKNLINQIEIQMKKPKRMVRVIK